MSDAPDSGDRVIGLLPRPGGPLALHGLYLRHELYRLGRPGRPYVYTNFVSSLDGRISWKNPATGYREVPPPCVSRHDMRLYNELAANADLMIASSRYLRGAAAGRAAGMLSLGEDARELVAWRRQRGLTDYPRVAVVSSSLRLPERGRLAPELGEILVLCCGEPDRQRREQAERQGYRVLPCGPSAGLDGAALIDALEGESCRSVYSVAGPRVHAALLRAGRLDRLYLTLAQVLLGGADFDTLVSGDGLEPARRFGLAELYHDPNEADGTAQLFAVLDRLE
jgi:riboflavin biosynthesis pyrimidine reductase